MPVRQAEAERCLPINNEGVTGNFSCYSFLFGRDNEFRFVSFLRYKTELPIILFPGHIYIKISIFFLYFVVSLHPI